MIPLCKDEWLESLPSFEEEEEEDEATPRDFASPPLLKETYSRRLSRGSLSKLPSDVASRSQVSDNRALLSDASKKLMHHAEHSFGARGSDHLPP